MSGISWTREQKEAIWDRDGQLLVSAAAGSGKTAVLVERAVQLICDAQHPVQADRLLIVTFTNAAAAEMRSRIADRLAQIAREQPGSSTLRRQRLLLQRAPICTIDAFCLQLLRKHFNALDIPPDFTTADEPLLFELRQKVLADVLEECYQDEGFCHFADLYGRSRSDAQTGQIILQVYDFLRSLPHPMDVLDRFCAQWQADVPFAKTTWAATLLDSAEQTVESAVLAARQALEKAQESQLLTDAYGAVLAEDVSRLEELQRVILSGDWNEAWRLSSGMKLGSLKAVRKAPLPDAMCKEQVQSQRKQVKALLESLQEDVFICTEEEFSVDRKRTVPLVEALSRAVKLFDRKYFEAKVHQKALEFSDFEHLALKLLQNDDGCRTELARQLSGGFDAVMVDEYQDTNALQDALYSSLAREDGSNLFFVGDLKQSIYRFRQADPAVFTEKLLRFAPLGSGYPARIALDANFRSAPGVIDGINYFFEQMMSPALGGVEYGPGQKLRIETSPGDAKPAYQGGTELRVITADGTAGDADYIARRIREMVRSGFEVRNKDGSLRPAGYGDFCILLRTRTNFDLYAAALEAQDVPVYTDSSEDILDAPHIRPLAALLRVLDNPAQDVYLASVMLSPLFGFLPDDLVRLRADFPKGSLYGAAAASERPEIVQFREKLKELRCLAQTLPADRLLEEIFANTGYLAVVGAQENGARRREDVRAFADFVSRAAGQTGLSGLIRMLDAAGSSGGLISSGAGQTRPDCVSIMTVHRSKGLEFPVVFVADTGHRFNLMDLNRTVLCHPELGIGLLLRGGEGRGGLYSTAVYRAVRARVHDESLSEEMRVLYVALTRARDRLIITLPAGDPQKLVSTLADELVGCQLSRYRMMHAQSCAPWLLSAAMAHPDARALHELAGRSMIHAATSSALEVGVEPEETAAAELDAGSGLPQSDPDLLLYQRLRQQFGWEYPRRALSQVPAKVSVTALAHKEEAPVLERPAFLSKQGLTAAERGTSLHAFLQNADFAAAPADLEGEIRRQQELGLLESERAAQLDRSALRTFFASPLFARMQQCTLLREYDFITALPAGAAMQDPDGDYGSARVLVQGIADAVLVFEDHIEILDYKTDRTKTAEELKKAYQGQLLLYAEAIEKRLAKPVTRCTLYSFALGREVSVLP